MVIGFAMIFAAIIITETKPKLPHIKKRAEAR